jgi:hypothetical protein
MTQIRKSNPPSTPESPSPEDQKRRDEMQRRTRFTIPYLIGAFVLIWLFQDFVLAPLVIRSTRNRSGCTQRRTSRLNASPTCSSMIQHCLARDSNSLPDVF